MYLAQCKLDMQNLNQNFVLSVFPYIKKIKQVLVMKVKDDFMCTLPLFWLLFIFICKLPSSSPTFLHTISTLRLFIGYIFTLKIFTSPESTHEA